MAARLSASTITDLLSASMARGSMLFSFALNSNAWVDVRLADRGFSLLKGSTMSGELMTLFMSRRNSLISGSTMGLTLFT